jgi:hypothetical protein
LKRLCLLLAPTGHGLVLCTGGPRWDVTSAPWRPSS